MLFESGVHQAVITGMNAFVTVASPHFLLIDYNKKCITFAAVRTLRLLQNVIHFRQAYSILLND